MYVGVVYTYSWMWMRPPQDSTREGRHPCNHRKGEPLSNGEDTEAMPNQNQIKKKSRLSRTMWSAPFVPVERLFNRSLFWNYDECKPSNFLQLHTYLRLPRNPVCNLWTVFLLHNLSRDWFGLTFCAANVDPCELMYGSGFPKLSKSAKPTQVRVLVNHQDREWNNHG